MANDIAKAFLQPICTETDGSPASLIGNIAASLSPMVKAFSMMPAQTKAIVDAFSDIGCGVANVWNWQSPNGES